MYSCSASDDNLRAALCRLIGAHHSDEDWRTPPCGNGARSAAECAPAAYVASVVAGEDLHLHRWCRFIESTSVVDSTSLPRRRLSLSAWLPAASSTKSSRARPRSLCRPISRPKQCPFSSALPTSSGTGSLTFTPAWSLELRIGTRQSLTPSIPTLSPLWKWDLFCALCGELLDVWKDRTLVMRREVGIPAQRHP